MKNRRFLLLTLVGAISFVSGGWLLQGNGSQSTTRAKRQLFEQVLQYVASYYVDSLDAGDLYDMAIEGMLEKLDDPYTSFLRREAYTELSLSTTGNYGGVGLRIDLRDGWVTVVSPIPNTPGQQAGIEPGDQIVEINETSTRGWTSDDAANVLRGEPGTDAKVTIVRAGYPDSLRFTLTRAQIHVSSVEGSMILNPGIGYLSLTNVSQSSAREMRESIDSLRSVGARSLIIDLRGNPGGILQQGVAIADLFLDPDDVVVETKGRAPGQTETFRAQMTELWPEMPVVVLVNRFTASAAEILAGALQDHDRGLVVGDPTFGKGVAYLMIQLSETEAVTVTSSRWYTPSGRSIQRVMRNAQTGEVFASMMPDAVRDSGQTYFTMGGRELPAGSGGIRPDVIIPVDTLTDSEKKFAAALGSNIPQYRNVMSRLALDLKGRNTITDPNFDVTPAMLQEFLARLRAEGVEMSDEAFDGGRTLIADQLAPEVVRYVFGREAEIRRLQQQDVQTDQAIQLLERANTPAQLISLGSRVGASLN